MNFDWKNIVKSVAPALGTALLGPMGGVATKFIADQLLGKSNASEKEIADTINNASTEQLIKLKELDHDFELRMKELNVDVYQLEVEDRKSARLRETLTKDWTPPALAFMIIGAFLTAIFLIVKDGNVTNTEESFLLLLSNLTTYVLAYYFGSSAGSRLKDIHNNK
jgi:hypothetical protein